MALVNLPITDDVARGSFVTDLDGVQYRINYYWSDTLESWYMDLISTEITLLNLKLVSGSDVLDAYGVSDILNSLFVLDTTALNEDPTRDDMGPTKRFRVLYGTV